MSKMDNLLEKCISKAQGNMLAADTIVKVSQAAGFCAGFLNGLRVSGVITKEMYNQAYSESKEILKRRVG